MQHNAPQQPIPGSAPAVTPAPWPDNLKQAVTDAAQQTAAVVTPAAPNGAAKPRKEKKVQAQAPNATAVEARATRPPRAAKAPPAAAPAARPARPAKAPTRAAKAAAKAAPAAAAPRGRKTVAQVVADGEARRGRPRGSGSNLSLDSIIQLGEHSIDDYIRPDTVRYRLMEAIVKSKGKRLETVLGKKVDADHEVGTVDVHFAVSEGYIVLK